MVFRAYYYHFGSHNLSLSSLFKPQLFWNFKNGTESFNFQLDSSMLISLKVFGILFMCTFCPHLYRLKTALTIIIIFQSNMYCIS